jgi:toxin ParE1/3/4
MQVKWLKKALANLDYEAAYIAQDNPVAAQKIVKTVLDTVALLADQPALGSPSRIAGTRELAVPDTRYLIPYRVKNGQVEILRVFHTARKPPERW